jgi:hypothetical protein
MPLNFFCFLYKKNQQFLLKKPVKIVVNNFFGVEGCAVDHPRITIIKEEEEENQFKL